MNLGRWFCATAVALVMLSGCGDGRLQTKGKVVRGGQPYVVPEGDYVRVTFYELAAGDKTGKNSYSATYNNKDGTFKAQGPDGHGIPPGRYRICIEHESKKKDLFRGAYNSETTPFVFDINSGTKELVIDLDRKS
jgi:hypothetical protein